MSPQESRLRWLPWVTLAGAGLLFTGFSLPHLSDPPVGTHGWRQSIAPSMGRLYAQGQPFLYPRAEACGVEPGVYMGSEFPLYAWLLGKLGGEHGINTAGRLLGLLSTLALMLATALIARHLFRRWSEPARTSAAVAAGAFLAVSPLLRFYGIGFVPDLPAHALALSGVALWLVPTRAGDSAGITLPGSAPPPLDAGRFALGAALIALGNLTKLIALPHLALAGLVLLDIARPRPALAGWRTMRPYLFGAALVALVAAACWLWYGLHVPVLKAGGCDLVWLPEKLDETWRTMTFTDAEWRRRMADWGRNDLLGPAWGVCLAGLVLALTAGGRGALLPVWALACGVGFVRLGWHTKQHDYDLLLVLPALAAGFGASFGTLVRAGGWAARRLRPLPKWLGAMAPCGALVLVLCALAPFAHRQSRRHFYTTYDEAGMEHALDRVLPRDEPIHYFGGRHDPRVPYYARRKGLGTEPWLYCRRQQVVFDCALAAGTQGRLSPCPERRPSVVWADMSLVCGIERPESPLVPERILDTLRARIAQPDDRLLSGAGRLLGIDRVQCGEDFVCAGNLVQKRFLDLYFVPERDGPQVQVLVSGKAVELDPAPAKWLAGTLVVARAEVPEGAAGPVEIRSGKEALRIPAMGAPARTARDDEAASPEVR